MQEREGLIENHVAALNLLFIGSRYGILHWKDIEDLFSALGVVQNIFSNKKLFATFNGISAEFEIPHIGDPVPRELALSVRRFLTEAGKGLEF